MSKIEELEQARRRHEERLESIDRLWAETADDKVNSVMLREIAKQLIILNSGISDLTQATYAVADSN